MVRWWPRRLEHPHKVIVHQKPALIVIAYENQCHEQDKDELADRSGCALPWRERIWPSARGITNANAE